ncbi:MAG: lamin tail domain-containing protein [Akkermansiaceae bacterium]
MNLPKTPLTLASIAMAGLALMISPADAELIAIPPGSVTASSEIGAPFNRQDDFIVNGSGLSGGQHTPAVEPNMWLSTGTSFGGDDPDPYVIFDLGAIYTISSFHVWNYNESPPNLTARGVNAVSIEYGATSALGSVLAGVTNFTKADGSAAYAGERFDSFTPFAARFIKFDIDSNHGGDNNFYGLSEIQFDGVLSNIEVSPDTFVTSAAHGATVGTLSTISGNPGDSFTYSLVAGAGSTDNAKFQTAGDELQVGPYDFITTADNTEFSVRVRATGSPSGKQIEKAVVVTALADADADGLLDAWEKQWAVNLGVLSGLGNANEDGDGFSDLEEFNLRGQFPNLDPTKADTDDDTLNDDVEIAGAGLRPPTDPTLADTDGDSLSDLVETNTGTFFSPTNTGSDPTNADTDGDTLGDGVETNSGVFIGSTDTGSNPNLTDTDGDTFNDNVEAAGGSNPSDPRSTPPTPPVGLDREASSPDAVVVFNELLYNPADATETGEWIELFNQMGIKVDISGWRIDGLNYIFPENTIIDPGSYLVVAKSPGPGELGPFPGSLANSGERLRLINTGDRLMDELIYGDDDRWPAAADGSGVSLAKLRPYTANTPAENWAASEQVGGTPGSDNFPGTINVPGLVFNELPPATQAIFWVELINTGPSIIELIDVTISAGADPLRESQLPAGQLAPGALLLIDEVSLGFRPADGEKLFLYNAGRTSVLDSRQVTGRNRGRANDGEWLYPSAPTPDEPNTFAFNEDIVISEIAYNPSSPQPATNSDNQWLEIANRSAAPVDLSRWFFGDGISFKFPAGTMLAGGEHACIARDAATFTSTFPGARLLGEFEGSLSRSGERLLLRDADNNPADEVRYFDSGRWPEAANSGSSTLELRDLYADNNTAESWAGSDESGQTSWKTYTYRSTASSDGGPTLWKEFNIGLLDSGEILLDDISVVEDPDGAATQMLSNTDFESGSTDWRLRGNHRHSEVITDPDNAGNKVLRLVASSVTEHMHNQLETTLAGGRSIVNGREYEISFRARWVTGTRLFHTRFYFSRLARANLIDRPEHVGTPSAPNSKAEANIGPTVNDLLHSPAVPDAGEAITVTARADDPDGVTGMTLRYSVNGATFQSIPMTSGAGETYQGIIPGQPAAAVVQFYLAASDSIGATSTFPADGPDSRALIKIEDGLAATNGLHNLRVILTNADRDLMYTNTEVMSNDRHRATIIDREEEIYYDAKVRLKGSQRARAYQPRVGLNMRFGADHPYRGVHQSIAIDRSEGVGSGQYELLFDLMMANSGGVISRYYDLVQIITPSGATHTRPAVLQMARYDDVFLNSQFENGSDGNLYEYDFVYYPQSTDGSGNKVPQGDGISGISIADNGDDKERYRFYLLKKNNRDADDYGPIISYCKQMSKSGIAFNDTLDQVVDVNNWLRGMAYGVLSGAGDNTAAGTGHNGMYYAHVDGRVMYLPHDMDFAFSNTRSIFANGECQKLANTSGNPGNAQRKRIYFGHLHDIISTTWNDSYMGMWQSHLGQLSPAQNWITPNSGTYSIGARAANVLSQINGQIPELAFGITTPSPLTISESTATVSGDGWVNVHEIRVAGAPEPLKVTWTDGDSWQVVLPATPGSHTYTLQAFDFSGVVIGGETITIINNGTTEPAASTNLAVSELMYHPADPTPVEVSAGFTDAELFEFIELTNIGSLNVDLSGVRFTEGIVFDLPDLTIAPGERVVIARDRAAFLSRHPGAAASLLDGDYYAPGNTNKLSNGGEELAISNSLGADIRRFTYDNNLTWPTAPDGGGASLVLIAPESNPDHGLAVSWRSSPHSGGNPGSSESMTFTGSPDEDLDGDGLSAFLEHALGTSDSDPKDAYANIFLLPIPGSNTMRYTLVKALAADDVVYTIQTSSDLETWHNESATSATLVESLPGPSGRITETWQIDLPPAAERYFVRLLVSVRQ